jgi:hypothetical protein
MTMNKTTSESSLSKIPFYNDPADVWFEILDSPVNYDPVIFKSLAKYVNNEKVTFKQNRRFIYKIPFESDYLVGFAIKNDKNVLKNKIEVKYTNCKETINLTTILNVSDYEIFNLTDIHLPLYMLNSKKNSIYIDLVNEYIPDCQFNVNNIEIYIIYKIGMIRGKTINKFKFIRNDINYKIDRRLRKLTKF